MSPLFSVTEADSPATQTATGRCQPQVMAESVSAGGPGGRERSAPHTARDAARCHRSVLPIDPGAFPLVKLSLASGPSVRKTASSPAVYRAYRTSAQRADGFCNALPHWIGAVTVRVSAMSRRIEERGKIAQPAHVLSYRLPEVFRLMHLICLRPGGSNAPSYSTSHLELGVVLGAYLTTGVT
jgi:hypothetical protein